MNKPDEAALEPRLEEIELDVSFTLNELGMELGQVRLLCQEMVADVQHAGASARLWATIALLERMERNADRARRKLRTAACR